MYIPYYKIGATLALFANPKYGMKILEFFNNLKIKSNCKYIEKNSKKVLKKLRKIYGKKQLRVAFLCDDATKWKSQSLYDLFLESDLFHPFIIATKNNAGLHTANPMTKDDVIRTYNFFKNKGLETHWGYDINKQEFIPIEKFKPDIIFYQQPWYIQTQQGPVITSKFALTYYVPYFVPNVSTEIEYGLRFHQYLHKHYVLNKIIYDYYSPKMRNKGKNLCIVGHPQLDYFYLNEHKLKTKKYVIYAPHWSINHPQEEYATFEWNGHYILDFAKSHPEIKWLFKPHPGLKRRLLTQKIMTQEEIDKYWNDWNNIGLNYESGDYLDLFSESYAMITDCGSFLTEFLLTEQPVIHLVSQKCVGYNPSVDKIVKSYYQAHDLTELKSYLERIILNKDDYKKPERLNILNELNLNNNYSAKNIIKDIKKELGCKEIKYLKRIK